MALYKVSSGDGFTPFAREELAEERVIHDWVEKNPDVLAPEGKLLVIGREVENEGGSIDLLCLNADGDLVIVELKKGRAPREVVAQALDYLSSVDSWDRDRLEATATEYFRRTEADYSSLEEAFLDGFRSEEASSEPASLPPLNRRQHVVIVAEEIPPAVARVARFLVERGVLVSCLEFTAYKADGGESLVDVATVVSPEEEPATAGLMTEEIFRQEAHPVAIRLREGLSAQKPGGGFLRWRSSSCVYQIRWDGKDWTLCVIWPTGITLYFRWWFDNVLPEAGTEEVRIVLRSIPGLEQKLDMKKPGCGFGEGIFEEKDIPRLVSAVDRLCAAIKGASRTADPNGSSSP